MRFSTGLILIVLVAACCMPGCGGNPPSRNELATMQMPELRGQLFWLQTGDGYLGWGDWKPDEFRRALRDRVYEVNPDWDDRTRRAIEAKEIFVGMTVDQVIMSWGRPTHIESRSLSHYGESEVWSYGNFPYNHWVYFDNDRVTLIHDNSP